jgi:hypothetical protein
MLFGPPAASKISLRTTAMLWMNPFITCPSGPSLAHVLSVWALFQASVESVPHEQAYKYRTHASHATHTA